VVHTFLLIQLLCLIQCTNTVVSRIYAPHFATLALVESVGEGGGGDYQEEGKRMVGISFLNHTVNLKMVFTWVWVCWSALKEY